MNKIISGGQTGADRAALDVAIKHRITHGGWVPRGRPAEDGYIPSKYNLQEMRSWSYSKRTEQNVIDSDGTLIFSHGPLIGGSALTVKMALKHSRPNLHIDLSDIYIFKASVLIFNWLRNNHIETLNVAGPRASEDPDIYRQVKAVLEDVLLLESNIDKSFEHTLIEELPKGRITNRPSSIDEAIEILLSEMILKDLTNLAKMAEDNLISLHFTLGMWIRNNFIYPRNDKLLKSCREVSLDNYLHWAQVHMVIIKELWKRLQDTHKLKVVK